MAASGERPGFERFGDGYALDEIPNHHLEDTVGLCWEMGLLDD